MNIVAEKLWNNWQETHKRRIVSVKIYMLFIHEYSSGKALE
jgi:hypothetical protein